jgi:DNA helicase II / ATP-dependent DNA helicase PcrA
MNFSKALRKLNPEQLKAVNTIEGPVMVIAGPGTGKTQILTLRIANILQKTDTLPQNILALTFTDSAAYNMRQRLLEFVGTTSYKVVISTFHSFASSLIKEYPDYFNNLPSKEALDDITRIQILESILDKNQFNLLKPPNSPHYYLNAILSSVSTLKREAVLPKDLAKILKQDLRKLENEKDDLSKSNFISKEKQILKNLELLDIYKKYQQSLINLNRFDYEDMINWVRDALKNNQDFSQIVQEKYQYLLVDEYQDTNNSQNEIINLLTSFWGENANIFVVGDDEQAIFRFQGASLENITSFLKAYPKAQIITLKNNYRSQQNILNGSRTLISNNKFNLQKQLPNIDRNLISKTNLPSKKIKIINIKNQSEENLFLAKKIKHLISKKVNLNQIAIIVRNNADLLSASDSLSHFNIPNFIVGGDNVLDSIAVKYLITLFKVIKNIRINQEGSNLFTLLNYPFTNIKALSILKLYRLSSKSGESFLNISQKNKSKIKNYIKKLINLNQKETENTFIKFAEISLKKSGFLNWLINQKDKSLLQDINSFFDLIKNLNQSDKDLHIDKFLDAIETLKENNIKISSSSDTDLANKVTITTAHKAKGQEWDFVFILNCIDGKWGGQTVRNLITLSSGILNSNQDHDPIEDERRLFYVALTRARRQVYITSALSYSSQGRIRQTLPSQFIEEIKEENKITKTIKYKEKSLNKLFINNLSPIKNNLKTKEKELIDNILKDFRLSVTALNTYLDCHYKFKLNNLYRIPSAKKTYLSFGTAVHSALEKFHKKYQLEQKLPSSEYLLDEFEAALKKEVLTRNEQTDRLSQGKKFLNKYFQIHRENMKPSLYIEKFFGTTTSPIILDDIFLTGKIDRIDLINSQTKEIKVIDYKTGKKKTRGQIEGTTADESGSLKRQLIFYRLLSDLDPSFPYKVTQAELDFIQSPAEMGKSGKESFNISEKDVQELKEIVKKVYKKIKNHQFSRTKNYIQCSNCEFKNHCWPDKIPTTISQSNQES